MKEPSRPVTAPDLWGVGQVIDGRYRVTGVHEHGGMGVVYRVRHLAWGTDLAVKCPRAESFRTEADREQFVTEAETWVSLGIHPNICGCHYVRVIDGVPRVFAEYVPGGSLRDWIDSRRLYRGDRAGVVARILDLAIQTAWGLEHAHGRGLVHQDVKPANVLLDDEGGTVTAKVTDFGLARARAVAAGVPGPDAPSGVSVPVPSGGMTPAYASPEQTAGRPLGRRSDIYSFAVSVLEMFNGGVTWLFGAIAGAALADFRASGGAGAAAVMPPALGDLLERCLHEDPGRRPASMAQVAADLGDIYRQVTGSPHAHRAPAAADLRADELNNRALSLYDLGRRSEAEEAFRAALTADPQHLSATYNAGLSRWRRGAITDEDLVGALEHIGAGPADPRQARHLLARVHLERGDLGTARAVLAGLERERPEEPEVAATLGAIRSGEVTDARCTEAREVPWRIQPDENTPLFDRIDSHIPVCLSADGRLALTGSQGSAARLWDVDSGACRTALDGHSGRVHSVALSADGRFAITADRSGVVRIWDVAAARCLRREVGDRTRVHAPFPPGEDFPVELSADARIALWLGDDRRRVQVQDLAGGETRWSLGDGFNQVESLAVSADGRLALSGDRARDWKHSVRLWDLDTGRCLRALTGLERKAGAMCFSADGDTAVVAGRDIHVWDWKTGRRVRTLTGHIESVTTLSLSADGRFLLSGAADNTVRFWDLRSGRCLRTLRGHGSYVSAVLLSADARSGLSAGQDNMVRRWRLPHGDGAGSTAAFQLSRPRRYAELNRLGTVVESLVAEAEQAMAAGRYPAALELLTRARATPGYERAPQVLAAWQHLGRFAVRTGLRAARPVKTLTTGFVFGADLSADGRIAVTDVLVDKVRIWDTDSGTCVRAIKGSQLPPGPVELSADGRRILNQSRDCTVMVWSADTGDCLWVLDRSERTVTGCFSADGRQVLTGREDGTIRVWDPDGRRCLRVLEGHRDRVTALWAGADGRLLASAAQDSVRLWDLDSGRCLHTLPGHTGAATAVCLSTDGRHLLSSGNKDDRSIRLWDTATGACVRTFDEHPGFAWVVRFSADGRFALSGGSDSTVRIWEVATGHCLRALKGHQKEVYDVALSSDGRVALSRGGDDVRLWELDWELAARDQADWDGGAATTRTGAGTDPLCPLCEAPLGAGDSFCAECGEPTHPPASGPADSAPAGA